MKKNTETHYSIVVQDVEWDTAKAASNKKKHKARGISLSFQEAEEVFFDPYAIEFFDAENSTLEESRFKVLGRIKRQVVIVAVYTPRNGKSRIISARYASPKERQVYLTTSEKEKIIAECEANAVPYEEIDFSEIPEITDFSNFKPLAMHSEYFKPVKESVTIRLDKMLVRYFRSKGKGW